MKIAELQGYELTQSFIDSVISLGYKERDYNGEFQEGKLQLDFLVLQQTFRDKR